MKPENLKGRLHQIVDELVRQGITLAQARREFERQFIDASIRSNEGNLGRSARRLGIHRNTLRNKVSELGIEAEKPRNRRESKRSFLKI
jgi:DNA-binding NtrC family response regulator